jgi:hypothetical protein
LSGEEFRQELRAALENKSLADKIRSLPWGSGSGMAVEGAHPGYVFCARVADHDRVQFRYVDYWPDQPTIEADTLACLANAKPPADMRTPRVLDDQTYNRAFDAWALAKSHIVEEWNRASDPANLAPQVPKAMHEAAELVRSNRPPEMTLEESEGLVECLLAPYPERILRRVRQILSSDCDPIEKVRKLAELAIEEAMRPAPEPEPLPEISEDDVHLVCWMAIVPDKSTDDGGD